MANKVLPDYKKRKKKHELTLSLNEAHSCLGHKSKTAIRRMVESGAVVGLQLLPPSKEREDVVNNCRCRVCIEANLKRADVPKARTSIITRPLQLVGSDVQTMEVRSYDGKLYFAVYCCQQSNFTASVSFSRKSEQAQAAQKVLPRLEVLANERIDTVRADQGGEYTSHEFRRFLERRGIRLEYSDTGEAFQNGLAETTGGKLVAMMRAARIESNVPKKYWTENLKLQTWIANRLSTKRQKCLTTPLEALSGQKADLSRARPYGCECWVLIRRSTKAKQSPRAELGVHMGVSLEKKAWRILLWKSKEIIESRNVVFFIHSFPFKRGEEPGIESERLKNQRRAEELFREEEIDDHNDADEHADRHETDDEDAEDHGAHEAAEDDVAVARAEDAAADAEAAEEAEADEAPVPRRSNRIRSEPVRFSDIDFDAPRRSAPENDDDNGADNGDHEGREQAAALTTLQIEAALALDDDEANAILSRRDVTKAFVTMTNNEDDDDEETIEAEVLMKRALVIATGQEPKTEEEAHADPAWRQAEEREIEALEENDYGDVVPRPKNGEQVLPTRMVYKVKETDKPEETLNKARFVVKGCCDKSKNEKQTYAPTLKFSSLRILIAICALMGAVLYQLDIKAAFTNGDLPYPVYVEQPRFYAKGDPTKFVIKLKKSLYGLVESPRLWNEKLNHELLRMGFQRLESDPCIYVRRTMRGKGRRRRTHITMLGVYTDDIFIFGTDEGEVNRMKNRLKGLFRTKDLGAARWALGMAVHQEDDMIWLSQEKYLGDVLARFEEHIKMRKLNPKTPLPPNIKLLKEALNDGERSSAADKPYRELIGSLMYLAVGTRPDIAFAISLLSRFISAPSETHWKAALHVLRYLRGTKGYSISFAKRKAAREGITVDVLEELERSFFLHSLIRTGHRIQTLRDRYRDKCS